MKLVQKNLPDTKELEEHLVETPPSPLDEEGGFEGCR